MLSNGSRSLPNSKPNGYSSASNPTGSESKSGSHSILKPRHQNGDIIAATNTVEFRRAADLAYRRGKLSVHRDHKAMGSSLSNLPAPTHHSPLKSALSKRRPRWGTKARRSATQRAKHRGRRVWKKQVLQLGVGIGASTLNSYPLSTPTSLRRSNGEVVVSGMQKDDFLNIIRSKSQQVEEHLGRGLSSFVEETARRQQRNNKNISVLDLTEDVDSVTESQDSGPAELYRPDMESMDEDLETSPSHRADYWRKRSIAKFDLLHADDVNMAKRFGSEFDASGYSTERILRHIESQQEEERALQSRSTRDSVKLRPLTEREELLIDNALSQSDSTIVGQHKGSNLDVRVKDLMTLESGQWLNDEVMNFYISLLQDRNNSRCKADPDHIRVLFMNTFFFTKLSNDGHKAVKRWTKKAKLKRKGLEGVATMFELDKVVFPVHVGGVHWCCGCINMKERKIEYYDSMNGSGQRFFVKTRQYLQSEAMDKLKGDEQCAFTKTVQEWECVDHRGEYPQQDNGYDCGVFSSKCADWISDDLFPDYGQQNMEYFRRRMQLEIIRGKTLDFECTAR